jgi:hypothetical protein
MHGKRFDNGLLLIQPCALHVYDPMIHRLTFVPDLCTPGDFAQLYSCRSACFINLVYNAMGMYKLAISMPDNSRNSLTAQAGVFWETRHALRFDIRSH